MESNSSDSDLEDKDEKLKRPKAKKIRAQGDLDSDEEVVYVKANPNEEKKRLLAQQKKCLAKRN